MDLSRLKKVLAGVSVAAITLTQISSVIAAYSDVPAGVWYEEAVKSFTDAGYLDAAQPRFRGTDTANRAEFVKLLVELNGGILSTPPAVPSFDDVGASAWYYGYMEEAGKEGWVKGDGNCYGSHPCYARPAANISRAEAAALIVRAFGLESTGDAAQFVDNPAGQWYTQAIQIAADHCVLQGDSTTGRVRPADNMNRAEMVVMLNRVDQGLVFGEDCGTGGPVSTPSISGAVATAASKVEVDFSVNLDQTAAETVANYAMSPAVTISSATLISEQTVELTFAEALSSSITYTVTASNMKTAAGAVFSDSASFKGYSALPKGEGTLEVAVSSKNPVGDTVPQGARGVTMVSMDLTASCEDSVTIETLTVLHEGFGDKNDIKGVYAAIDGARVSRARTVDSKDQTAELRFTSPLVIPACKSVMVDIAADFNTSITTGAEHNFAVELQSDFTSNAKTVTGNFPMRGNTFRVGAVTSGTVTVTYRSVTPNQLEVGDKNVLIGKFEVSTSSIEDQTLYSMTLHQNGTVSDGDVTNIRVRRTDGTVLTNAADQFRSKFATVTFNPPFTVLEGDRIVLEVVGDVVDGAAKTIQTDFEEDTDVFAVGSLYGYGVNGQLYGSAVTRSGTATPVTIEAGQFTIEINGPSQQTYTRDQNDATLSNVVFTTGGETVDMKKLYIAVRATTITGAELLNVGGTAYDEVYEVLENVTLRNASTGRSIEGVRLTTTGSNGNNSGGATAGAYQIYRFDDFTISGKETYQLKVDFIDNGSGNHPLNGDQFSAIICGNTGTTNTCDFNALITPAVTTYNMEIEGLSTGEDITDVRPGGSIVGNAMRIADSSLTIGVIENTTTDTAVKSAKNVRLMRFEARAGEAKSVLLTKFIFEAVHGTLGSTAKNGTNYTLWVDTDGNNEVDTILDKGKAAAGTDTTGWNVTFDTLTNGGFVLNKESTVMFEVRSDIAGALVLPNNLQLRFATGATVSYVEAETVDRGSALSGIKTVDPAESLTGSACSTNCDITVDMEVSPTLSLVAQGNLIVTEDTSVSLSSRQLLAGGLGDAILRLNLHAENEPIDVTNLNITTSGSTIGSVESLELYKEGATSYFARATTANCSGQDVPAVNPHGNPTVVTFCASMQTQQLVVPKGGPDVKVLVKPRLKNDENSAVPNQTVWLWVDHNNAMSSSTGTGSVRARGVDSSGPLNGNDSDDDGEVVIGGTTAVGATNAIIRGEKNLTVLSKIASIVNNPLNSSSQVQAVTGFELARMKIAAAANTNTKNTANKVTLSGVIFNITSAGVVIDQSTFKLYNVAAPSFTDTCTAYNLTSDTVLGHSASGSFAVRCDNIAKSTVNAAIDPGSDATFALTADVTSVSSTHNLTASLQNFSDIAKTAFGQLTAAMSHFEWTDKDSSTDTTASFKWVEYPTTSVNFTSFSGG
ncbi:MAG: S-layer homology domain-containing protein [Candidatus Peribacteraceae bacterium]|nr:S-layer homology domain-containing protein [Candidatus Peribacteraceae bacterium]